MLTGRGISENWQKYQFSKIEFSHVRGYSPQKSGGLLAAGRIYINPVSRNHNSIDTKIARVCDHHPIGGNLRQRVICR